MKVVMTADIKHFPINGSKGKRFKIDLRKDQEYDLDVKESDNGHISVFGYNKSFSGTIMIPVNKLVSSNVAKII